MNILLLGNGFDLAHFLPTTYLDFISFLKRININNKLKDPSYKEVLEKYVLDPSNQEIINILNNLFQNNLWYEHFKEKTTFNNNWCDFEKEIEYVTKQLEEAKQKIEKKQSLNLSTLITSEHDFLFKAVENYINHKVSKDCKMTLQNQKIYIHKFNRLTSDIISIQLTLNVNYPDEYNNLDLLPNSNTTIAFEKLIEHILNQLNDFTKCFELYLFHFVNKINIKKISFIQKILSDDHNLKVINFNYTNTLNYYDFYNKNNVCHIHGEALNNEENNLVLGINETENNIDPMFTRFRKYFQRFEKRCDLSYRNWIDIISTTQNSFFSSQQYLHIIGHSLTLSDRNILYELITIPTIRIKIYYHSPNSEINLMQNLAAILGHQKFTEYMENKKINFEQGMF